MQHDIEKALADLPNGKLMRVEDVQNILLDLRKAAIELNTMKESVR